MFISSIRMINFESVNKQALKINFTLMLLVLRILPIIEEMEESKIKLKSLKLRFSQNTDNIRRFRVIFISQHLSWEDKLMCQTLTSKFTFDFHNFNTWAQFKKQKLNQELRNIFIIKKQSLPTLTTHALTKTGAGFILLVPNLQTMLQFKDIDSFELITSDTKEILSYLQQLMKEKKAINHQNNMEFYKQNNPNTPKFKPSAEELKWEKRVLRVMALNNFQ